MFYVKILKINVINWDGLVVFYLVINYGYEDICGDFIVKGVSIYIIMRDG